MTHFLVEYNNKIIGNYTDYETAEAFILGCLQNNLMQSMAKILKYKLNSCYMLEETVVTLNSKQFDLTWVSSSAEPTNLGGRAELFHVQEKQHSTPPELVQHHTTPILAPQPIDFTKPEVIEIAKQKLDLQHNINLLKVHKYRIEESKKIYENDLKLFNIFSENKSKDVDFMIPPLFVDKFSIFEKLKAENKLCWENFTSLHKKENYYGDYFGVNDYEEFFYKPSNKNDMDSVSEDIDIESDSNTETSDN